MPAALVKCINANTILVVSLYITLPYAGPQYRFSNRTKILFPIFRNALMKFLHLEIGFLTFLLNISCGHQLIL